MGLAPYGNSNSNETVKFKELIKNNLVDIKEDGSIWLNQTYFNYATGLKMTKNKKWKKLFGLKRREAETDINQSHCNFALAIQQVTEEIVIKMAYEAKKITNADYLCLSGGVALNCVANGKLLQEGIFKNIYIQPASGDAGGSLGSALAVNYMFFKEKRKIDYLFDGMKGTYLGPDFSTKEITSMNKKVKASCKEYKNFEELSKIISLKLEEGSIVGWFQGRMEFGPRALGNRSILGDSRIPEMQKKLNLKIKYREGFRPFAPSVLAEKCNDYFDLTTKSPYMLIVAPVKEKRRVKLSAEFQNLPLLKKLYTKRSDIQSVTHLDYSARVQTVHKETNPRYWELITAFEKRTNYGLIVNTSFNIRGEPIVCNPYDAYRCFMSTDMDYLVINDFVYFKKEQPDWQFKEKWLTKFKTD